MLRVKRNSFHWDSELEKFLSESSSMGFRPGRWPLRFEVETGDGVKTFKRGEPILLYNRLPGEDFGGYNYLTDDEDLFILTVFND